MRLIVTSQLDVAGTNIYNTLSEQFSEDGEFEERPIYKKGDVWLIATKERQIEAGHLDSFFQPEYYVFASRHSSVSKERTLTVHVPGNLSGEAKFGGRPYEIAYSNADAMKTALIELQKAKEELNLDYRVSLEATHHGPTELKKPVLFVEVGSTIDEWNDKDAIDIVARASLRAAENRVVFDKAIGIGGRHYAPLHTKVVLGSELAVGHILPSYSIGHLREETLLQAVEKTKASFAYLDRKGMRAYERSRILEMASKIGLELKRGRDLKSQPDVLKRYNEYSLPPDFIGEVEKVSRKALEKAFRDLGIVVRHAMDGRVLNVFSAPRDIRNELIRRCIGILREKYEVRVEREGDSLVLTETKFDPLKAEKLGLKPGPLFGELSRGKSVNLNNGEIIPDMVQKKVEKIIRFKTEI
ncbi:MAG: D-aminoacyl-tRNA deacylase [Candidatus Hydrothermarchaeaceae archaeon]